jgi:hypothetical protein
MPCKLVNEQYFLTNYFYYINTYSNLKTINNQKTEKDS